MLPSFPRSVVLNSLLRARSPASAWNHSELGSTSPDSTTVYLWPILVQFVTGEPLFMRLPQVFFGGAHVRQTFTLTGEPCDCVCERALMRLNDVFVRSAFEKKEKKKASLQIALTICFCRHLVFVWNIIQTYRHGKIW